MRKTLNTVAVLVIVALAVAPVLAGPRESGDKPLRYNPVSLDGALTTLQVGTTTWSAWAYRSGAEYDIAISFQRAGDHGERFWSEPAFIGRADGRDQVQPALAADGAGNLYMAYVDRGVGAIRLTVLPAGSEQWAPALTLTSAGQRGDMPALHVTGGSLIVAFRSGRDVVIRELALLPGGANGRGIHEGPDPWSYENDDSDGGIPGQNGGGEEDEGGGGDGDGDNSGSSWGGRRGW